MWIPVGWLVGAGCLVCALVICFAWLYRSERRFRMLAENSDDVVCFHTEEGCAYVSHSVRRLLGVTKCPLNPATPEETVRVQQVVQTAIRTQQPARVMFKAVSLAEETAWLETLLRPLPNGVVVASTRDVTERKRVEDLYRILADSLPKSTCVLFDRNLRVLLAVGPLIRHLERPMEGLALMDVFRSLYDDEQLAAATPFWGQALTGRASTLEVHLQGSTFEVQHIPVLEASVVVGGLIIANDVSDERRREMFLTERTEELERSNRDLEQFADIASHEMKTPLRHIAGFAELLGEEYEGLLSEDADVYIGHITQGVREMNGVIEALLRYSRAKTTEGRMQEVSLGHIMTQVASSFKVAMLKLGGRVEWDALPVVRGDPVLLKHLLENIVWNGLKFSGTNPWVRVTATRDLLHWVVVVEDNGPGVEVEHRDLIFQMFKRSRMDVEGSGVGLALCRKIVGIHRGRIWVEDGTGPADQPGSRFVFTMPAQRT